MSTIISDGQTSPEAASLLRSLPSIDKLMRAEILQNLIEEGSPRELVLELAREILGQIRASVRNGSLSDVTTLTLDALGKQVATEVSEVLNGSLCEVINASGVILHTNLGRAPLSQEAALAVQRIARSFNNLEYDLESGERGNRMSHLNGLVARLCGSEAALVVNNNAAAVFMVLSTFAKEREVILSRGQAIEIGGSFRIPDVMVQSGAKLIEVGTTNKTYLSDYAAAITPQTAVIMRVHSSNFKIIGFTHNTPLAEMAQLASKNDLILVDDLGSGTFIDTARYGLAHEPTVQESIQAGAELVTFSGDKLLGGPQAGLIAGKKILVDQLKKHPLARALRVDKMTIAALQVTLQHYLKNEAETKIPTWQMISHPLANIEKQAHEWCSRLEHLWPGAKVLESLSAIGGGSLPGETLPTYLLALPVPTGQSAKILTAALRHQHPPIIG
ncbi:MAG: L-seryl-tRNA(Sec) selenium transferase, partial [Chloroflexota bacterium]